MCSIGAWSLSLEIPVLARRTLDTDTALAAVSRNKGQNSRAQDAEDRACTAAGRAWRDPLQRGRHGRKDNSCQLSAVS